MKKTETPAGFPAVTHSFVRSQDELARSLLSTLARDFLEHGAGAIEGIRATKPVDYLKLVVSLLPKEREKPASGLESMGDEELETLIGAARTALRLLETGGAGGGEPDGEESSGAISSIPKTS